MNVTNLEEVLKKIYLFILLVFLLCSCRDQYLFSDPVDEHPYDFILECDLNPKKIVALKIIESLSIGEELKDYDRRDAEIMFYGDDVPEGGLPMAYNSTSEKYHIVNENFLVKEGLTYGVQIVMPETEQDTITAWTTIPVATKMISIEFTDVRKMTDNEEFNHYEVDVLIRLSDPVSKPAYYRFLPYRFPSFKILNPNGTEGVLHESLDKITLMKVKEIYTDRAAFQEFNQSEGIYIDESRLTSNLLSLTLNTIKPLRDGYNIEREDMIEFLQKFMFELETLNTDRYDYEKWVHVITQSQGSVQAREIANISNASGLFGGTSRSLTFPQL